MTGSTPAPADDSPAGEVLALQQAIAQLTQREARFQQQQQQILRRLTEVENEREQLYWEFHRQGLAEDSLFDVIQQVIMGHFDISRRDMRGSTRARSGRPSSADKRASINLDTARHWTVILLMQCTGRSAESLKANFLWMTQNRFIAANQAVRSILDDGQHPDRLLWRLLLHKVRTRAAQFHLDTQPVDDELNALL